MFLPQDESGSINPPINWLETALVESLTALEHLKDRSYLHKSITWTKAHARLIASEDKSNDILANAVNAKWEAERS